MNKALLLVAGAAIVLIGGSGCASDGYLRVYNGNRVHGELVHETVFGVTSAHASRVVMLNRTGDIFIDVMNDKGKHKMIEPNSPMALKAYPGKHVYACQLYRKGKGKKGKLTKIDHPDALFSVEIHFTDTRLAVVRDSYYSHSYNRRGNRRRTYSRAYTRSYSRSYVIEVPVSGRSTINFDKQNGLVVPTVIVGETSTVDRRTRYTHNLWVVNETGNVDIVLKDKIVSPNQKTEISGNWSGMDVSIDVTYKKSGTDQADNAPGDIIVVNFPEDERNTVTVLRFRREGNGVTYTVERSGIDAQQTASRKVQLSF